MSTPQLRTWSPEVAQVVHDRRVRRVERPASVAVAQRRAGRVVDDAPVLVLGAEAGRARLHHEGGEPQAAPQAEPMDLLDHLAEVVGEPLSRPPGAVRLLPAVVDLEQVEAGPPAEALAQELRVLQQAAGADAGRVVVPGLPAERRRTRPRAPGGQRREPLGDRERIGSGADRDRLRDDLLAGRDGRLVVAARISWPQLPSTRWCVGDPSECTTTSSPVRAMRVTRCSQVSAWIAIAPVGVVSVVLQYESVPSKSARTPAYDHES